MPESSVLQEAYVRFNFETTSLVDEINKTTSGAVLLWLYSVVKSQIRVGADREISETQAILSLNVEANFENNEIMHYKRCNSHYCAVLQALFANPCFPFEKEYWLCSMLSMMIENNSGAWYYGGGQLPDHDTSLGFGALAITILNNPRVKRLVDWAKKENLSEFAIKEFSRLEAEAGSFVPNPNQYNDPQGVYVLIDTEIPPKNNQSEDPNTSFADWNGPLTHTLKQARRKR